MKNLMKVSRYMDDVSYASEIDLPWEKLKNTKVLIAGASGMIGSFLVDVLMFRNQNMGMNCKIYAVGRNKNFAEERFQLYWKSPIFTFISHDISQPLEMRTGEKFDYILHLASNTHPVMYAIQPINTITTNVLGTDNLLRYAVGHCVKRFLFVSSNEVYGENRGDVEFFDERYCGYIDSNTLRAGYPESKRCSEALCQAYRKEKGVDIVISRLTRSYGPTMLMSDTKAVSQFIKNGISGQDIILKSEGTQYYSYTYVADAVTGLLTVLLKGQDGEAYNIADEKSDIVLRELAAIIARFSGRKVVFELPDRIEKAGYSMATKARLNGNKVKSLGWNMKYNIREGIERTLSILGK